MNELPLIQDRLLLLHFFLKGTNSQNRRNSRILWSCYSPKIWWL